MSSIRRTQISRDVDPADRALAEEISRSLEAGDPSVETLSTVEVERAWQARDRFAGTPERLRSLLSLSRLLGARPPADLEADPAERIFGAKAGTRRARILCTVGPASSDPDKLATMIAAGMDGARINFSHIEKPEDAEALVKALRTAMEKAGRSIVIIADLQGPKLRIGVVKDAVALPAGARATLYSEGSTRPAGLSLPVANPDVVGALKVGDRVFIDDGKILLKVVTKQAGSVEVDVVAGGEVTSKKGLNLPDTQTPEKLPTTKDRADLATIKGLGIDTVMVSYVESAEDIENVRRLVGPGVKLIAKLERPKAVDALEAIAKASDGLLVARGDAAVELGDEHMPAVQAKINALGNELGVPTGVATQMMESMLSSPRPSRSDASDVARAVMEEADWVMTSAETAIGSAPEQIIRMMAKIIDATEAARAPTAWSSTAVRAAQEIDVRAVASIASETSRRALAFTSGEPVRAASAIVPFSGGWLVAQDDSNVAAHVTSEGVLALGLSKSANAPDSPLKKALKPDLEAGITFSSNGREISVLFGSGSTPLRMRAAVVEGTPLRQAQGRPASARFVSLDGLYLAAMDALRIGPEALNLEGACVVNGAVRFFQRGNAESGVNASFDVPLDSLVGAIEKRRPLTSRDLSNVRRYSLGALEGAGFGFSGAAALPDGRVLFSATAENSSSTYHDGQVAGSVLGLLDERQRIVATWRLPGAPVKLEGIAIEGVEGREARVVGVTDADDPSRASELIRYTLDVPG
ncbi:MAG: pyruvate kinase [Deltaproteobacteria bacterium]|nr:pyruvate kinase [Deltaproteobacteria bacterium]